MCPYCGRPSCCNPDPAEVQEIQDELREWKAARRAVAAAQSYTIGSRSLTRANLGDIRRTIKDLENDLDALMLCRGRGMFVMTGIPRDNL